MAGELPDTGVEVPDIDQVAFVVENLYDGMDRFGTALGIDGWQVYRFEPPTLTDQRYRGKTVDNAHRIAITYPTQDDIMLELMEPLEEPNLYQDFLDEFGEGMHHVACFAFEDPEAVVARFEDAGIPVLQYGKYRDVEFWYFDTQDILNGVIFEVVKNPDGTGEPDATYS